MTQTTAICALVVIPLLLAIAIYVTILEQRIRALERDRNGDAQ